MKKKKIIVAVLLVLLLLLICGLILFFVLNRHTDEPDDKPPSKVPEIETQESDIEIFDYKEYDYTDETTKTEQEKRFDTIKDQTGNKTDGSQKNEPDAPSGGASGETDDGNTLKYDESRNEGDVIDINEW